MGTKTKTIMTYANMIPRTQVTKDFNASHLDVLLLLFFLRQITGGMKYAQTENVVGSFFRQRSQMLLCSMMMENRRKNYSAKFPGFYA